MQEKKSSGTYGKSTSPTFWTRKIFVQPCGIVYQLLGCVFVDLTCSDYNKILCFRPSLLLLLLFYLTLSYWCAPHPSSSPLHYQVWLTASLLPRLLCHLSCSAMPAGWLHSTTACGDNNLHWSYPSAYPAVTNGNRLSCSSTIDCPTFGCSSAWWRMGLCWSAAVLFAIYFLNFAVTHQRLLWIDLIFVTCLLNCIYSVWEVLP